ncbi:MAG TPA: efflux RND transporter periplasmic adaptor subunit [Stellaceae bacterium]|jgi:membrane fusion protein (multidrug efflux system)|nr:efflux RND transporter periplasmic adaptor subunit [Stellaceae bacterium]
MLREVGFRMRLLAAVCLLLPLLVGCDEKKQAAAPADPAVGVRPAAMKGVSQSFEFVGHIKATDKVDVRARIEGFLEKVAFREGQDVKAGDLLYQLEQPPFQAQVNTAQASVAQFEAQYRNAQVTLERAQYLLKTVAGQQSNVDSALAAERALAAQIEGAKAQLQTAQINLGYTEIRAPINGRIGRTAYTLGNLVNPASGVLATIVSQDPIYVLFPVSVRDLEIIREARRKEEGGLAKIDIRLRLPNGSEYPHRGVWNLTDPQVDQQTDTLIMRAIIPNPERQLTDGEFVTAIIRERREAPRLVVPQAAVQIDQSGRYVLVVDDQNKVAQRRIETGPDQGTDVVVTSGIKEGEKVIIDGIQKVRPGQVVQVTELPTAGG